MKRYCLLGFLVLVFVVSFTVSALAKGDRLNPGEYMTPGNILVSHNGKYIFMLQTDGNIVLRKVEKNGKKKVLWSSGTSKYNVTKLIMQHDGNLVLYLHRHASWSTGTGGHPGAFLVVQDDGNVVIYTKDGKKPIWSTNTAQ